MPERLTIPSDKNADHVLFGRSHPVLTVVAFGAAFFFTGLPFLFGTDNAVVVAACVIATCSSAILCMRLVIGELGLVKWLLLATAGYMTFVAGGEWYVVVFLTAGTLLCSLVLNRIVGDFVPLVRGTKC